MTTRQSSRTPRTWGCLLAVLLLPDFPIGPTAEDRCRYGRVPPDPHHRQVRGSGKRCEKGNALRQQKLKVHRQFKLLPQTVVLDLADESEAKAAAALPPQARAKGLRDRIAALQATGLFEYVEPDYIRSLPRRADRQPPSPTARSGPCTTSARTAAPRRGHRRGGGLGHHHRLDQRHRGRSWTPASATPTRTWQPNVAQPRRHQFVCGTNADGDGYMDNVYGINTVTGSGDPMDDYGHGTHVAGTIGAAANNGDPHVGVAWNVRLMACKFLDAQGGCQYTLSATKSSASSLPWPKARASSTPATAAITIPRAEYEALREPA